MRSSAFTRRTFLRHAAALATAAGPLGRLAAGTERAVLPVAAVVTEYSENSHADVIVGKILAGFDQQGGPGPALKLVSLYTDQVPKTDLSRGLADGGKRRETPELAVRYTPADWTFANREG